LCLLRLYHVTGCKILNLFWQKGDLYLTLVSDDTALSQGDLVDTAASVY